MRNFLKPNLAKIFLFFSMVIFSGFIIYIAPLLLAGMIAVNLEGWNLGALGYVIFFIIALLGWPAVVLYELLFYINFLIIPLPSNFIIDILPILILLIIYWYLLSCLLFFLISWFVGKIKPLFSNFSSRLKK